MNRYLRMAARLAFIALVVLGLGTAVRGAYASAAPAEACSSTSTLPTSGQGGSGGGSSDGGTRVTFTILPTALVTLDANGVPTAIRTNTLKPPTCDNYWVVLPLGQAPGSPASLNVVNYAMSHLGPSHAWQPGTAYPLG